MKELRDNRAVWANEDRTLPLEAATHSAVCHPPCPDIIEFRGYRVYPQLRILRIATDYAEGGDMFKLGEQFRLGNPVPVSGTGTGANRFSVNHANMKLKSTPKSNMKYPDAPKEYAALPHGFVWRLWIALVDAAIHMHEADVIHLDFHLSNVFFNPVEDDEIMDGWGFKPQVNDFGWALPTNSTRFENPADFDLGATRLGAPEQHLTCPPLLRDPNDKVSEKTSVFHIAVIIHQFLNGFDVAHVPRPGPEPDGNDPLWPYHSDDINDSIDPIEEQQLLEDALFNHDHNLAEYHASSFKPLLKTCMRFSPNDRLTLQELRAALFDELEKCKDEPPDGLCEAEDDTDRRLAAYDPTAAIKTRKELIRQKILKVTQPRADEAIGARGGIDTRLNKDLDSSSLDNGSRTVPRMARIMVRRMVGRMFGEWRAGRLEEWCYAYLEETQRRRRGR